MPQQIPTEVGQEAEDYPCPILPLLLHGNLEPGLTGAVTFRDPTGLYLKSVYSNRQTKKAS